MRIDFIDIQNFRKLKNCRVKLSEKKTVFVGANNSGKTSAMEAIIGFLKKSQRRNLSTTDFTLSNWKGINKIASNWLNMNSNNLDLDSNSWYSYVPSLDVWLQVEDSEVHYISHIIPTLDWTGGKVGVRLVFEPKNIEELYKSYKQSFEAAKKTSESRKNGKKTKLWPQSMKDFLDKKLHEYFKVNAYILDPSKCIKDTPQALLKNSDPIDEDPFNGLFKIDIINAQRGFSDPNTKEDSASDRKLSTQLKSYFEKHLDPSELPEADDLDALDAIDAAKKTFDEKLKNSFKNSIKELEELNYPGFSDPTIQISSKLNLLDGLNHDATVQFDVFGDNSNSDNTSLTLPEKYNGLGYQNLISIIFKLIRYRDEWMRVGKAGKQIESRNNFIEPLHIVLIEEPEAHLHAQAQQVFIKKTYEILRNHNALKKNTQFSTQLIISTHSSYIAHEIDFVNLRYFKRTPATSTNTVPYAKVVDLSDTFGDDLDTAKFAIRYLKTTHCDLFFADATILVEGPAERILIPHFIKHHFPKLYRNYISILEIGGSHAHRLQPLIEKLGLLSLIITDLDPIEKDSTSKAQPKKGVGYRTRNNTLKSWIPKKTNLDEVLSVNNENKVSDGCIRVAYQHEISVQYSGNEETAIPYTFEDALVLNNIDLFKEKTSTGLIKKMSKAVNKSTLSEACQSMFNELGESRKKAEMALELLYTTEPEDLKPPKYIEEGMEWLQDQLNEKKVK